MKLVFVDVETGGLDPKVHGITEIAAVAFDFDPQNPFLEKLHAAFQVLVRPNTKLAYTPHALNLQDRTLQYLDEYGVSESEAWVAFETFLRMQLNRWQGHIVAHYAQLDYGFLAALAERCGKAAALPAAKRCEWLCTKNLFRVLSGLEIVSPSSCGLEDIMRWYGIGFAGKEHHALIDAEAGVKVFRHMVSDLKQYYGGKKQ
jgi:DNA polymerase III epsilon subunit-like protein